MNLTKNREEIRNNYDKSLKLYKSILESEPEPNLKRDTQKKIGNIYLKISEYSDKKENSNNAIKIYKELIQSFTLKDFPRDYASIQNNLGVAYVTLAEVETKSAERTKQAIEAYKEALKVYVSSPTANYAMTQGNLGTAYHMLAEVEKDNRLQNCTKAIEAYKKALTIYTLESFPRPYAVTKNNLGMAYVTLAEVGKKQVENYVKNYGKAIKAYKEALQVFTKEKFPLEYAGVQNSLGITYRKLAEMLYGNHKADNYRSLALEAFEEALTVYTLEDFPVLYAVAYNNLGNIYFMLAEVEDEVENYGKAIKAYEEALKVHTSERSPRQYADTKNNLGNVYGALAEVEDKDKIENCCTNAIEAYKEALKIYTLEKFPVLYANIRLNLASIYRKLADVGKDKGEMWKLVIEGCKEAIKVYIHEKPPMLREYASAQSCLSSAFGMLARLENKTENCKQLREAYREACQGFRQVYRKYPDAIKQIESRLEKKHGEDIKFCEANRRKTFMDKWQD